MAATLWVQPAPACGQREPVLVSHRAARYALSG